MVFGEQSAWWLVYRMFNLWNIWYFLKLSSEITIKIYVRLSINLLSVWLGINET